MGLDATIFSFWMLSFKPTFSLSTFTFIKGSSLYVINVVSSAYLGISPPNEYSWLISFRMDWLDLLAVQGTVESLLQCHILKASILWCSTFFMVLFSSAVGDLALGSPALEPTGPRDALTGGLQEGSHQWVLARTAAASVSVPTVSLSHLHLHKRPSRTSKQVWPALLTGTLIFFPGPWCTQGLFPPVVWHSSAQTLLAFRAGFSGDTSSHCLTLSLRSLT